MILLYIYIEKCASFRYVVFTGLKRVFAIRMDFTVYKHFANYVGV